MEPKAELRKTMKIILFLLIGGILNILPEKSHAQNAMDYFAAMEIGENLGANIQGAVNAALEMRNSGTAASSEIDQARNQYWGAVKSGKGVEAAGKEFRRQLWMKDLYYLMMSIPEGTSGPRATILNLISGGIDGGIRPEARPYFEHWVKAIRVHLGAETWFAREETNNFVLPSFSALAEALKASQDQQAAYIRVRDWAEIDASGLSFPWDQDAKSHVLMILYRYTPENSAQEIQVNYQELVALFGEREVLAAGEKIRQAPRDSEGKITDPSALGLYSRSPDAAFAELLATKDGLTYFKYLIWQSGNSPADAKKLYDIYTYIYDPHQIKSVATQVLHAPRNYDNTLSVEARSDLDVSEFDPSFAIPEILSKSDPLGEIKFLVANGINCKSKDQLDQAVNSLLDKYGKEKLIKSHKAYYTHLKYQNRWSNARSPEQIEKAKAIRKEFEGKNLTEDQQQYHMLIKTLENGIWDTYALKNLSYD